MMACEFGCTANLKLLLEAGADMEAIDSMVLVDWQSQVVYSLLGLYYVSLNFILFLLRLNSTNTQRSCTRHRTAKSASWSALSQQARMRIMRILWVNLCHCMPFKIQQKFSLKTKIALITRLLPQNGCSALLLAEHAAVAKLLLDAGADTEAKEEKWVSVAH